MEVAGSSERLQVFLDRGEIPKPDLMQFNRWLQWRTNVGRRPLIKRDGECTTMRQESDLWQATMAYLYGGTWMSDLTMATAEDPEPGDESVDEAGGTIVASEPQPAGQRVASTPAGGAAVGELVYDYFYAVGARTDSHGGGMPH